jgi:hypothetical protein
LPHHSYISGTHFTSTMHDWLQLYDLVADVLAYSKYQLTPVAPHHLKKEVICIIGTRSAQSQQDILLC